MFFNGIIAPIFDVGSASGVLIGDASATQHIRAALTGDCEIGVPRNPVDGGILEYWLNASGGDRALSLDPAIALGVNGSDLFPWTLSQGETLVLILRYDGHRPIWFLSNVAGGY